jgi:hypothetical protein
MTIVERLGSASLEEYDLRGARIMASTGFRRVDVRRENPASNKV